jgi:NAD(P)H dehydrogenase (quinone)
MKNVLITGATGSVGGALAKLLAQEATISLRLAARDPQKIQLPNAEAVKFDFERPETYAQSLENANTVFVLPPVGPTMPQTVGQFLEAARAGGHVQAVVYLAGLNASTTGRGFAKLHGDTIAVLQQTGMPYTILEPVEFMKNYLPHMVAPEQYPVIALPQGQASKSLIAHQDIAAIAAKVVVDGQHTGARLPLAGHDYNNAQIADLIKTLTRQPVAYQPVSLDEYHQQLTAGGLPDWLVNCLTELNLEIVAGKNLVANSVATSLLGRSPMRMEAFVEQILVGS